MHALTATQMQGMTTRDIAVLSTSQVFALSEMGFTALQTQALSANAKQVYTPIVLDLNGNGITTLAMADGVQFDLLASGQPVQTGWVAPSDGLLVRDLNVDGTINNGTELFGNATVLADGSKASDGYQALAELDSNHDGVISNADAVFSQLGVWIDADTDGVSDAGELRSLTDLGITEIAVTAEVTTTQDNGNTIGLTSSYQTVDGVKHLAGDVWFAAQDAASYAALSALSTAAVEALRTDQLSALSTVQVQALSTVELAALQTQAVSALANGDGLAPFMARSETSANTSSAQAASACDTDASRPQQDVAVVLAVGLAQRASAMAQAIGTFDAAGGPRSVATLSLNAPVDSNGATMRSASLAVGNLVNQMRSFDSQADSTAGGTAGMGTAAPSALTSMQVAPIGMLDPLKKPALNDFASLSGFDLKR
jgi:hypothetical protein